VAHRPFDALAERLGMDPDAVLARLERMVEAGTVRRIGPVFDSRRLGYVTTLVAAKVRPARLHDVAEAASALPGVTHNYERRHAYNLWFTLAARSEEALAASLEALADETNVRLDSLPAEAVYKIRMALAVEGEAVPGAAPPPDLDTPAETLTEREKALVRALQDGLPVVPAPFDEIAERAGWTAADAIRQVRDWLTSGVIRRFGAVVGHRRLGYSANGMAVFSIRPERIDAAGRAIAAHPEVTHCYRRRPLPDFPYTLFAMMHGGSEAEVRERARAMAEEVGAEAWDVLFSLTEFKKTLMRYFV
jgi:DNA-binding Lrp family transcriptional regulator